MKKHLNHIPRKYIYKKKKKSSDEFESLLFVVIFNDCWLVFNLLTWRY